ncbi:Rod shape-determining protein MreD [Methylophaga frappieri]|uniref:Rod shape-determining protein MreD n=1 Tax=Methylophaga frappieri (strain ATCC BAA-2434 / DSM 25690 / JAM7) TaxID=754477 RepID=I1YHD8_METFJ|nr:rod shape-determining protein MreD [Methylophaga frappieri]AFJ02331.1 Rod shape-determining protein MreD [Methylophaga frappieri]
MASYSRAQQIWVIYLTLLIALVLMLVPIPDVVSLARPEWVIMTLIYWAMALPQRVSIGTAWVTGLIMDIATGGQLGVHAFAYALAIYIIGRLHLQLRQYPLLQQAFIILSLVFLVHVVSVMNAPFANPWHIWMPAVSSTLMWPFIYALLRKIRRGLQVS